MELTKQDIQNIISFMERSQIVGKEAYVFVPLVTKLMTILKEKGEQKQNNLQECSPSLKN